MKAKEYLCGTAWLFDTEIRIKIPVRFGEKTLRYLFDIASAVENNFSSFKPDSEISRINRHAGTPVYVSCRCSDLLEKVKETGSLLGGCYDITVISLLKVWGFFRSRDKSPCDDEIEKARLLVDYNKIKMGSGTVTIGAGQHITTGSFLKAFAVDKIRSAMQDAGIGDAVINAGGSTIAAINNAEHAHWNARTVIGNRPVTISLSNNCLSTSTQQERYSTINGKRYGHVINPVTGYPAENLQVSIITGDCLTGDILATGLMCFNPNDFIAKLKRLQDLFPVEGYLTDKDGETVMTEGFRKMLC